MHTIHIAPSNELRNSTIQRALKLLHTIEALNYSSNNKHTITPTRIAELQVEAHGLRRLIEAELDPLA